MNGRRNALYGALVLAAGLSLTGCGGGTAAAPAGAAVAVAPALGRFEAGTVVVIRGADLAEWSRGTIAADGRINVNVGSHTGIMVVEVLGDGVHRYFNEGTNAWVVFPAGQVMRAVASGVTAAIGVTPLTDTAARRLNTATPPAFALAGVTALQVETMNAQVAGQFGLFNILQPPVLLDGTNQATAADGEAGLYALQLAALSTRANANGGRKSHEMAEELAKDLEDGALDGMNGANPTLLPIDAAGAQTDWRNAAQNPDFAAPGDSPFFLGMVDDDDRAIQTATPTPTQVQARTQFAGDLGQAKKFFADLRGGILPYTNSAGTGFLDTQNQQLQQEANALTTSPLDGLEVVTKIERWADDLHAGVMPPLPCNGTVAAATCMLWPNGQWSPMGWIPGQPVPVQLTNNGTAWDMGGGLTGTIVHGANSMTLNGYVPGMTGGATKAKVGNPDGSTQFNDQPLMVTRSATGQADVWRYDVQGTLKDLANCTQAGCTAIFKLAFAQGSYFNQHEPNPPYVLGANSSTDLMDPAKTLGNFTGIFSTGNYRFTGNLVLSNMQSKNFTNVSPQQCWNGVTMAPCWTWTGKEVVGAQGSFTGTVNGTGLTGVDNNTNNNFDILVGKLEANVDGSNWDPNQPESATNYNTGSLTFTGTTFLSAVDPGLKLVMLMNQTGWGQGTMTVNYNDYNKGISITGSSPYDSYSQATQYVTLNDGNGILVRIGTDSTTNVLKGVTPLATINKGRINYTDGSFESLL